MPHTWHDPLKPAAINFNLISIHMPHTWHDFLFPEILSRKTDISIHMPHTWHDVTQAHAFRGCGYFNPHATYVA